jgi:hypothetical protein
MTAERTSARRRKDVIEAFAMGVSAVIGKACWDCLEFDVVRRTNQKQLAAAVALDKSQVSRQSRSGTIEFHRLIYVLTTHGKTLGSLPTEFPVRSALKLSGIRYLAYRCPWEVTSKKPTYQDILDTFSLWDFFVANEIGKHSSMWIELSLANRQYDNSTRDHMSKDHRMSEALAELKKNASATLDDYITTIKRAFGTRYEDSELRSCDLSIHEGTIPRLLPWTEKIREADRQLYEWVTDKQNSDHVTWGVR